MKAKVREFLRLSPTFAEVTGEKLIERIFAPHILNKVKRNNYITVPYKVKTLSLEIYVRQSPTH